jgi:hypothetical protein
MSTYEVPLTSQSQTFSVSLAGKQYQMALTWRDAPLQPGGGWFLDISDPNANAILSGIPLVTGIDLLEQYAYLNFGGQLWVVTDGDPTAIPTFSNLGSSAHLYFVVP